MTAKAGGRSLPEEVCYELLAESTNQVVEIFLVHVVQTQVVIHWKILHVFTLHHCYSKCYKVDN